MSCSAFAMRRRPASARPCASRLVRRQGANELSSSTQSCLPSSRGRLRALTSCRGDEVARLIADRCFLDDRRVRDRTPREASRALPTSATVQLTFADLLPGRDQPRTAGCATTATFDRDALKSGSPSLQFQPALTPLAEVRPCPPPATRFPRPPSPARITPKCSAPRPATGFASPTPSSSSRSRRISQLTAKR